MLSNFLNWLVELGKSLSISDWITLLSVMTAVISVINPIVYHVYRKYFLTGGSSAAELEAYNKVKKLSCFNGSPCIDVIKKNITEINMILTTKKHYRFINADDIYWFLSRPMAYIYMSDFLYTTNWFLYIDHKTNGFEMKWRIMKKWFSHDLVEIFLTAVSVILIVTLVYISTIIVQFKLYPVLIFPIYVIYLIIYLSLRFFKLNRVSNKLVDSNYFIRKKIEEAQTSRNYL